MKLNQRLTWHRDASVNSDLTGKRIATGGGIGRALSRYLARLGAEVMVVGQTFRDADLSLMREAQRIVPLLNNNGQAILPSAGLTDGHIRKFMAASEALLSRTATQGMAS